MSSVNQLVYLTIRTYDITPNLKGGGGGHPDFFVKLFFEIAVDQQTKACDQNFDGVPVSGCPPVPAGQPRPYLVNLWPNFARITFKCSPLNISN